MQHRTVSDLMTRGVVSVRRETGFKDVARLLAEHDITAVPVVDDNGCPVGVVSEADLLRRQAGQPDAAGLLPRPHPRPADRAAEGARTAGGLMSHPAVAARPEWTVVEAARVMDRHHVKRLPVTDEADRLVGMLSRSDLLRVFLRQDSAIRDEISREIFDRTLGFAPGQATVTVTDGRVTLRGKVDFGALMPVVERLCRSVDGVVDVRNHLSYEVEEGRRAALP